MEISNQEYSRLVQARVKPSPLWRDVAWAFGVGGAICVLGQALLNRYQSLGLDQEQADKLAKRAGAGTLVPITGFANAMVSPALEFKSEGFITGTAAKLFVVAGPVLVYGISASILYGLLLYFLGG